MAKPKYIPKFPEPGDTVIILRGPTMTGTVISSNRSSDAIYVDLKEYGFNREMKYLGKDVRVIREAEKKEKKVSRIESSIPFSEKVRMDTRTITPIDSLGTIESEKPKSVPKPKAKPENPLKEIIAKRKEEAFWR